MLVTKEIEFDAAHFLPHYHGKCERLHGHTFKLAVTLHGKVNPDGMVFDFVRLKDLMTERIFQKLDHRCLNDIMPNPSAENIALWSWHQLRELPIREIRVWETSSCYVVATAEDYARYEHQEVDSTAVNTR